MKQISLALMLLAAGVARAAYAGDYASCTDVAISNPGLTLPGYQGKMPRGADYYQKGRVCYNGRDISDWAAGPGRRVASGLPLPYGKSEILIEALSPSEVEPSYLVRVYEDITGQLKRQVLLASRHSENAESSIDRFQISWFDQEAGSVFFETPAYATSSAVWLIRLPVSDWSSPLRPQFVSRGWVEWGNPSSSTAPWVAIYTDDLVPGQGRVPRYYLHRPDGSRMCRAEDKPFNPFLPKCMSTLR